MHCRRLTNRIAIFMCFIYGLSTCFPYCAAVLRKTSHANCHTTLANRSLRTLCVGMKIRVFVKIYYSIIKKALELGFDSRQLNGISGGKFHDRCEIISDHIIFGMIG